MGEVVELAEKAWAGELSGTQVHPGRALVGFEALADGLGFMSAFSNVAAVSETHPNRKSSSSSKLEAGVFSASATDSALLIFPPVMFDSIHADVENEATVTNRPIEIFRSGVNGKNELMVG